MRDFSVSGRLAVDAARKLFPRVSESGQLRLEAGDDLRDRLVGRTVLHRLLQVVVGRLDVVGVRGLDVLGVGDDLVPGGLDVVECGLELILRRAEPGALQRDYRGGEAVQARAQVLLRLRRRFLVAPACGEPRACRESEDGECERPLHGETPSVGTTYVRATKSCSPRRRASNRIGSSPANIGMIATSSAPNRTTDLSRRGGSPK